MSELPVSFEDVREAARRLRGVAHRTPVLRSRQIDGISGASVVFKCENLQRIGAFKIRGAYTALSRAVERGDVRAAADADPGRGVLTWSSGNHAQAVALASRLLGLRATIVMPSDAPAVKLRATRGYLEGTGGEVVEYDRRTTEREALGAQIASERDLFIVPPYDHVDVIAGQGTAALELFEQLAAEGQEPPEAIFVPCGGGGFLSGSALAAGGMAPGCSVIGVEPEAADDATRSFRTGVLQTVKNPDTIADGARTPSLGEHTTFPIVRALVRDMVTVSDAELVEAMRLVWERMKLVIEPTAALGLAGLLKTRDAWQGRRVGVMISGGNAELASALRLFG